MEPNTLTLRGGPKPSPGGYISQNNLAPAFTIETLDQLEKDLNILPPSKAITPPTPTPTPSPLTPIPRLPPGGAKSPIFPAMFIVAIDLLLA